MSNSLMTLEDLPAYFDNLNYPSAGILAKSAFDIFPKSICLAKHAQYNFLIGLYKRNLSIAFRINKISIN